jgi:hypothetical protein
MCCALLAAPRWLHTVLRGNVVSLEGALQPGSEAAMSRYRSADGGRGDGAARGADSDDDLAVQEEEDAELELRWQEHEETLDRLWESDPLLRGWRPGQVGWGWHDLPATLPAQPCMRMPAALLSQRLLPPQSGGLAATPIA